MHTKQSAVALLSASLLLMSCAKPMTMQMRIAAHEAEIRTATIEEKHVPILLGIHPGATLPSLFQNVVPEAEEGVAYWEWAEVSGETRRVVKTAYAKLRPGDVEFPFAKEVDFSKIYMGIGLHFTFLYKKPTGEWIQRLILPGFLSKRVTQENFSLKQREALRYADKNIQLIDAELIPAAQRATFIAHTFEMILVP